MHDSTKYRFFGAHSNNEESPPVFPRPNAKGVDSTAPQGIILALLGDISEPSQDAGLFALQILLLSASVVVKTLWSLAGFSGIKARLIVHQEVSMTGRCRSADVSLVVCGY